MIVKAVNMDIESKLVFLISSFIIIADTYPAVAYKHLNFRSSYFLAKGLMIAEKRTPPLFRFTLPTPTPAIAIFM